MRYVQRDVEGQHVLSLRGVGEKILMRPLYFISGVLFGGVFLVALRVVGPSVWLFFGPLALVIGIVLGWLDDQEKRG
jgi:hypothetical protein